tara:strand:- start:3001 stop:6891 length:3891 start_codon:yes stop_codon:yes gene_type:complete
VQLNFLNKLIFGLFFSLTGFVFSNDVVAQLRIAPIVIIQSSQDEFSVKVSKEIIQAFKYANFEYTILDLEESKVIPLTPSTNLIINTTSFIALISDKERSNLIEYISMGGNMIFFATVSDERFAYIQGIKAGADYSIDQIVRGIKSVDNIFPGFQDYEFYSNRSVPHNRLKKSSFTNEIRVLATAVTDKEYPILYENEIGLGKVLVFNSYILYEKVYRGLMFSSVIKLLPHIPYRNANVGTIFLDDFPAPLYNTKIEPIATEYDMEQADFVANIWWPEMKKLADSLWITYSAMTTFNYNANIVPPFDYNEWTSAIIRKGNKNVKGSIYLAKDILRTKHELAFHGYNHFSLLSEEWDANRSFMESALRSVKKRWRVDDLGPLPVTYVPPTNLIDSLGIKALTNALPAIKIMSSLYSGTKEFGGAREFGPDPFSNTLFNYPRISSGFNMDGNSIFNQHSMQLLTGVWNHFVHPDDIFQNVQRDVDAFESRNSDNLGWRTSADTSTSLYNEFVKRISYTKKQYPFIRLVSAKHGAEIAQDWLATNSEYSEDEDNYLVNITPPAKYISKSSNSDAKYWFMYVPRGERALVEKHLSNIADGYTFSKFWDGYLFQFYSKSNLIDIPKPRSSIKEKTEITANLELAKKRYQSYLTNPFYLGLSPQTVLVREIPLEKKLKTTINKYFKNPKNLAIQEELIDLSLESDQVMRAIQILEYRLKSNPNWNKNDTDRLVTYYGFESAFVRAEKYLEELWRKYGDEKVILLKDKIAERLGLYSTDFLRRWRLREIEIYGATDDRVLAYTSAIESQQTWPEVKSRLLGLIKENPRSDSLYAYTIQRSFFYEPSDSTIALLEEFPQWSHNQLTPFATQFANIYGYGIFDYEKALYWAERSIDVLRKSKLEWIAQKNEMDRFYETSKQYLENSPEDDSLRVYAGTTLYYLGYREQGREIMYPLFGQGKNTDTQAHRLLEEDFKFITYRDKKDLYLRYPNFFNERERKKFKNDLRWNEGVRVSLFGEYFTDNFDNQTARGGLSVQFGNRRNRTHLFKLEDIYVSNFEGGQNFYSNFTGIGYEYEKRKEDFSRVFRFGPSLFYGSEGILGEAFVSYSISYASTFTALNLSFEPEYIRQSLLRDIYKLKGEFYREDPWFKNNFLTTLSGNTQFYTNSVIGYSVTGRAYLQPWGTPFRGRLIGELGWQDASKSFPNADPFFTQNNYFLQGIGFDLRYRHPNTFDYNSLFEIEIMGKHAASDGYFMTGRANIEHKFKQFWQIKVGTEFSTSTVYQSNRIFFTLSHFFHKKLKHPKQR